MSKISDEMFEVAGQLFDKRISCNDAIEKILSLSVTEIKEEIDGLNMVYVDVPSAERLLFVKLDDVLAILEKYQ